MRENPRFALSEVAEVRRLIEENPWVSLISATSAGELVASHYPVILDRAAADDEIVLLSHVGRPDEQLHELGAHELLVIVQGPHGYISPGWYDAAPAVPTWNFVTAHLHGTPEILGDAENLGVLADLVDHFEDRMPEPRRMNGTLANAEYAARIVSHVGRPDEKLHELGQHEVLVIVQGPHGYISPGWYGNDDFVPTWNHVTAHLYGTPQILGDDENFAVLDDLVDHFERQLPDPVSLDIDETQARRIAKGTVGIRLVVTRFDARLKLSQNKPPEVVDRIIAALETEGPFASPSLAAEMKRERGDAPA